MNGWCHIWSFWLVWWWLSLPFLVSYCCCIPDIPYRYICLYTYIYIYGWWWAPCTLCMHAFICIYIHAFATLPSFILLLCSAYVNVYALVACPGCICLGCPSWFPIVVVFYISWLFDALPAAYVYTSYLCVCILIHRYNLLPVYDELAGVIFNQSWPGISPFAVHVTPWRAVMSLVALSFSGLLYAQ